MLRWCIRKRLDQLGCSTWDDLVARVKAKKEVLWGPLPSTNGIEHAQELVGLVEKSGFYWNVDDQGYFRLCLSQPENPGKVYNHVLERLRQTAG